MNKATVKLLTGIMGDYTPAWVTTVSKPEIDYTDEIAEANDPKQRTRITISFMDGKDFQLTHTNECKISHLTPYLEFYKWYFTKTSDKYALEYSDGRMIIRRDDINRVDIRVVK